MSIGEDVSIGVEDLKSLTVEKDCVPRGLEL
jgi:hypothetical protein